MDKTFWLRKGLVAGRTGPNKDPWQIEDFKNNGFSAILSVNEGEMVHKSLVESLNLVYANISMSPNAPIRIGDKEHCLRNLPNAIKFISDNMANGPVLIHCRSGKDRTGLVMAALLIVLENLTVEQAMQEVFKVRLIAFSSEGWLEFVPEVLQEFIAQNDLAKL